MTTEQVRDLLHDLLAWRQAQGPLAGHGTRITGYHETGDTVQIAFDDGTVATFTITIEGGTE